MMKVHASITIDRVIKAVEADDHLGFCTFCGADAHSVDPDAQNDKCEECGMNCVFGAEELLIMITV